MPKKLNSFKIFADGKEIGTATNICFPNIDPQNIRNAFNQFSVALTKFNIKLRSNPCKHWLGFYGSAEYYKEIEQKNNRQLLSGTYIGEIK